MQRIDLCNSQGLEQGVGKNIDSRLGIELNAGQHWFRPGLHNDAIAIGILREPAYRQLITKSGEPADAFYHLMINRGEPPHRFDTVGDSEVRSMPNTSNI